MPSTITVIATITNQDKSLHKVSLIPSVAQVVVLNTNIRRLNLVIQLTIQFLTLVETKTLLTLAQIFV